MRRKIIDAEFEVVGEPKPEPINHAIGVTASEWNAWHILAKLTFLVVYAGGMALVYFAAKTLLDIIFPT